MSKSGGQPRKSSHVNRRVTQSGFRSFDYAMATGRPLNTYVVIHLRDTPAQSATAAFTRIRHKHRDWQDRRSKKAGERLPPIYVCVFENPNGQVHVNWTLHVPEAWAGEFERKLRGWIEKVQGPLGPYDLHDFFLYHVLRFGFAPALSATVHPGPIPCRSKPCPMIAVPSIRNT